MIYIAGVLPGIVANSEFRAHDQAGNLGAQLLKLEEAGYIAVQKTFVLRKPQSIYRITENGREALTEYVQALRQLLGSAITI